MEDETTCTGKNAGYRDDTGPGNVQAIVNVSAQLQVLFIEVAATMTIYLRVLRQWESGKFTHCLTLKQIKVVYSSQRP